MKLTQFRVGQEVKFINDLEYTRKKYSVTYSFQSLIRKKGAKFRVTYVSSQYLRINSRYKVCPEDVVSLIESPYQKMEQKTPELFNVSKLVESDEQ